MNRWIWGIVFLFLVSAGTWAQATWRGQAEVWTAAGVPADGFVGASNEFPRNSLLSVENYRTHKTVQVRIVAALPTGSSALVLLNAKAAAALDIKAGEVPLVGVRLDGNGVERADNPDPDVNPLALKPASATAKTDPTDGTKADGTKADGTKADATHEPAPEAGLPVVPVVPVPVVPVVAPPVPTLPPVAAAPAAGNPAPGTPTTPAIDPDLKPLAALAAPAPLPVPAVVADPVPVEVPSSAPLAVADEPEPSAPVTPGKKVFVTTRNPEPVADETPAEVVPADPAPTAAPAPEPEVPAVAAAPVEVTPIETAPAVVEAPPAPAPEPTPVPPTPEPAPVAEAPAVAAPGAALPEGPSVPVVPAPVVTPPLVSAPLGTVPLAVVPAPASAWVSVPGKLEGPVLGQVAVLSALEKGRAYVQVGSWASEAELLAALDRVKTYVPLAIFKAEGQKSPWRLVTQSAPKAQLGVLLALYRAEGFRTASVVKG